MKKMLLFMLLLIPNMVLARSKTNCDYTLVSNLKKLTNNVDVTYTYHIEDDIAYYDITLSNIQPDMYFVDNLNNITYYYSNTNNGVITINNYYSGKITYSFYSNNSDCLNEKLGVKTVNLPYYNKYYDYQECNGIEDYNLCQKWVKFDYGYYDFIEKINEYKNSIIDNDNNDLINNNKNIFDRIISFYLKYYYVFLPLSIGIIFGILYLVKYIKFRLNRFNI